MAEIRIALLRGLRALVPDAPGFLAEEAFEAERVLKYRQLCLAGCKSERCLHRCRLYEPLPGVSTDAARRSAA